MTNDYSSFKDIDADVIENTKEERVSRVVKGNTIIDQSIVYASQIGDFVTLYSRIDKESEEERRIKVKILAFANGKVLGETVDNFYNPMPVGSKVSFSKNRIFVASDS